MSIHLPTYIYLSSYRMHTLSLSFLLIERLARPLLDLSRASSRSLTLLAHTPLMLSPRSPRDASAPDAAESIPLTPLDARAVLTRRGIRRAASAVDRKLRGKQRTLEWRQ